MKYYQNVKNWAIFPYVTFYSWKTGVRDLEKPIVAIIARKHLIFRNKKSHMEKMHRFSHFGNNSIDSERPDIKFFKTGLIYPYILP